MKSLIYIVFFLLMAVPAIAEDLYEPKPSRFTMQSFVVLPDTEVYVSPEITEYDLYFFQDWFWQKHGLDWWRTRSWNNRWTRYYFINIRQGNPVACSGEELPPPFFLTLLSQHARIWL